MSFVRKRKLYFWGGQWKKMGGGDKIKQIIHVVWHVNLGEIVCIKERERERNKTATK